MRRLLFPFFSVFFLVIFVVASCWAQAPAIATTATVPPLIKVSGTISSVNSGTVGVNFALYAEQTGGAPLWLETQNVALNANGRYTIYLGANHTNGVPMDLFASGEARWLGVQPEGQAEQARVMLVSVPYAMTAGDAQTLGGQPLSAFVLASAATGSTTTASSATTAAASGGVVALATPQGTGTDVTTSGGATNYLSKFTAADGRLFVRASDRCRRGSDCQRWHECHDGGSGAEQSWRGSQRCTYRHHVAGRADCGFAECCLHEHR